MPRRRHISAKEKLQIFQRDDGVCHICKLQIDAGYEKWDAEHVIPVKMGGDDSYMSENIRPAHKSCHDGKSKDDAGHIAKAKRMDQRQAGVKRTSSRGFRGYRRFNGELVLKD